MGILVRSLFITCRETDRVFHLLMFNCILLMNFMDNNDIMGILSYDQYFCHSFNTLSNNFSPAVLCKSVHIFLRSIK